MFRIYRKYILLFFVLLGFENLSPMKKTGEQSNKRKGLDPLPLNKGEFEKVYKKFEKVGKEIEDIKKKLSENSVLKEKFEVFEKTISELDSAIKKINEDDLRKKEFVLDKFNSLSKTVTENIKNFKEELDDFNKQKSLNSNKIDNTEAKYFKASIYTISRALAVIAACEIYLWLKVKKLFKSLNKEVIN